MSRNKKMGNAATVEKKSDPLNFLELENLGGPPSQKKISNTDGNHEGIVWKQPTAVVTSSYDNDVQPPEIIESAWRERYAILRRGCIFYYSVTHREQLDLRLLTQVSQGK
jgi:hypothetical protein